MNWKDKVVLVTGSCSGLGLELNRQLLLMGAKVVYHSRSGSKPLNAFALDAVQQGKAIHLQGDVQSYDANVKLVEETLGFYGRLDVLINNAGISSVGSLEETEVQTLNEVFFSNLMAGLYLSKIAIPHLKHSAGKIYFISSLAAFYGLPNYLSYSSSKVALKTAQEALSAELKPQGISVGIIYLPFVQNDQTKYTLNEKGEKVEVPQRNKRLLLSQSEAATRIIKAISRSRQRVYPSLTAYIYKTLNQYFPRLVSWLVNRNYKKQRA